jgi:hypothetical protein
MQSQRAAPLAGASGPRRSQQPAAAEGAALAQQEQREDSPLAGTANERTWAPYTTRPTSRHTDIGVRVSIMVSCDAAAAPACRWQSGQRAAGGVWLRWTCVCRTAARPKKRKDILNCCVLCVLVVEQRTERRAERGRARAALGCALPLSSVQTAEAEAEAEGRSHNAAGNRKATLGAHTQTTQSTHADNACGAFERWCARTGCSS